MLLFWIFFLLAGLATVKLQRPVILDGEEFGGNLKTTIRPPDTGSGKAKATCNR